MIEPAPGLRSPKLDPKVRALLESAPPRPAFSALGAEAARALPTPLNPSPEAVFSVVQRSIQGPGGWLAVRVYRPAGAGPFPGLLYFHGGGFVLGGLDTTDRFCRAITNLVPCVSIAVDYRRAPETPFPGALDDAYAALQWAAASVAELAIDPERIAVGGFSAGANLATATAMLARDRRGPAVALQLLVQGMFDAKCDEPSQQEFDGVVMTHDDMRWFWAQYLSRPEDAEDPHASVAAARDLRGLPPALVVTGECDLLRDEDEAYAERLHAAGVNTTVRRYPAMPHGFLSMPLDLSRRAMGDIATTLKERLTPGR